MEKFGHEIKPEDTLRVLNIFAELDCSGCDINESIPPCNLEEEGDSSWLAGQIPSNPDCFDTM